MFIVTELFASLCHVFERHSVTLEMHWNQFTVGDPPARPGPAVQAHDALPVGWEEGVEDWGMDI